eukprot:gene5370-5909_t
MSEDKHSLLLGVEEFDFDDTNTRGASDLPPRPSSEDNHTQTTVESDDDDNEEEEDIEQSPTDQTQSKAAQQKKKKKRRYIYRGPFAFPQIFRTDLRRNYPIMWLNVVNQNDAKVFRDFLNLTCAKSCSHTNVFNRPVSGVMPLVTKISSRDQTTLHLAYRSAVSPDSMCEMIAPFQIRRSRDRPGTQLIMRIRHSGTVLYELSIPELQQIPRDETAIAYLPSIDAKKLNKHRSPAPLERQFSMVLDGIFFVNFDDNLHVSDFHYVNTHWSMSRVAATI